MKFTEHKKLNNPNYTAVHLFAEWLSENGYIVVSESRTFADDHEMIIKTKQPEELVYEFFEVDKNALEKERQKTLDDFLSKTEG